MSDVAKIKADIEHLQSKLEKLSSESASLCNHMTTSGVNAEAYPGLAELEEVRTQAETIQRELILVKHKSKMDPEVLDLEEKLNDVLNKYFLLWHKCKSKIE